MATFKFLTRLGAGKELRSGTAHFYGLVDGTPRQLGTRPVDTMGFSMNLDTSNCTYLYVVLRVRNYDVSVGSRNILLVSVFRSEDANGPAVLIGERETVATTFCFARFAGIEGEAGWGVTFDANDTMYVADFFAVREAPPVDGEEDVQGDFGLTVFRNGEETAAGMLKLPTGGSPVMLANGYGLYGSGKPPSYHPISRLTSSVVDRVGNLWAINNWKPSAYIDFESNPGGDGLVIFVGIAEPNRSAATHSVPHSGMFRRTIRGRSVQECP